MTKLTKTPVFTAAGPVKETQMEKTTRAAKEITDDETEKRQVKTSRLRQARHDREAGVPNVATPKEGPKKPQTKSVGQD